MLEQSRSEIKPSSTRLNTRFMNKRYAFSRKNRFFQSELSKCLNIKGLHAIGVSEATCIITSARCAGTLFVRSVTDVLELMVSSVPVRAQGFSILLDSLQAGSPQAGGEAAA